jgi:hypothetical protein
VEGESLAKICKREGMPPYHVVSRWRRDSGEFKEMMEMARVDRAEMLRDKAMEEAEQADETDVASRKLKHDAYKWAAGVDDHARYSPKAKVEGTINLPTQIVISTGISRVVEEVKNEREVSSQNFTALPDSAGSTAGASAANEGREALREVHSVPSAAAK